MANPTPSAIAAIQGKVTEWTPTNEAIRDSLNTRNLANPTPQPQVAKPITVTSIMSLVGVTQRVKLWARPALPQIIVDIRAGDRTALKNWAQTALDAGDLLQAERDAIAAECDATVGDPDWLAQLSWAEINLGRMVDAADIAAARP